jgi:hypothetical protein
MIIRVVRLWPSPLDADRVPRVCAHGLAITGWSPRSVPTNVVTVTFKPLLWAVVMATCWSLAKKMASLNAYRGQDIQVYGIGLSAHTKAPVRTVSAANSTESRRILLSRLIDR